MSFRKYIEKLDAVTGGIFLILTIPLLFIAFYALSRFIDSNLVFYSGIYICGILSFVPLWILTGIFLLMTNPAKYKEYQMKKLQKEKEKERQKYFCLFLVFCGINRNLKTINSNYLHNGDK